MQHTVATILFELAWQSDQARHRDRYLAAKVNFWRDLIPPQLLPLENAKPGTQVSFTLPKGDSIPLRDSSAVLSVLPNQFKHEFTPCRRIDPKIGRYYPLSILSGIPAYFKGNFRPCRCLDVSDSALLFDANHPLAERDVEVIATLQKRVDKVSDHGGQCFDWIEISASMGPGMQARDNALQCDFSAGDGYRRSDESDDAIFYRGPRILTHVDTTTSEQINLLLTELLPKGGRILDLMSSSHSHLPESFDSLQVIGLGLNKQELENNSHLNDFLLQDLNSSSQLPFANDEYDAAMCHLSIEYLTDPVSVLSEVGRVLKPGCPFIITFSNRWFEPKAIALWSELHEFERMGLVLDYFFRSGEFERMETLSVRGFERPEGDRYFGRLASSDPLYAVWGYARKSTE